MQHDAWVQAAAAAAHHQAVQRRESHGRGDAFALPQGAHARPVAQVRHHHTAIGGSAQVRRQGAGDVFIRQAMKAVALDAGLRDVARQGKGLRDPRLRGVKFGVKTRHLRHTGQHHVNGANGRQVVRLVQRSQCAQPFKLRQNRGRDAHRARKCLAAMHHAVAHRPQCAAVGMLPEPVKQLLESFFGAVYRVGGHPDAAVFKRGTVWPPYPQAGLGANAFDHAVGNARQRGIGGRVINRKLDTGRAGVDDQKRLCAGAFRNGRLDVDSHGHSF